MTAQSKRLPVLVCLFTGTALAFGTDPFVGKWRWVEDKTADQGLRLTIEKVGSNTYEFKRAFVLPTKIVADGTQQPDPNGGTISLIEQPGGIWKLLAIAPSGTKTEIVDRVTPDGRALLAQNKETNPDGEVTTTKYDFQRVGSGSGLAGTWERSGNMTQVNGQPFEMVIEQYEGDGLTFSFPRNKEKQSMKFDGKEYPDRGPDVTKGSVASGKRTDAHTIFITDRIGDKVIDTHELKLSLDNKTITQRVKPTGENKEMILTFTRVE